MGKPIVTCHPNGHFYSPVVDPREVETRRGALWPDRLPECAGIDFNDRSHEGILEDEFPKYISDYDYPERDPGDGRFFTRNSQFSWLDSRALFVMLRSVRPKRMIEVGSGFSSLLTADVNTRFLEGSVHFACIEPYPRDFLKAPVEGLSELIVEPVQRVAPARFDRLDEGDVLFIDSSHVAKTGSDVNHLIFDVLPRLQSGVLVHIHDIFLPQEYPAEWVIRQNRSWNEQYILRALLMYSSAFDVVFGCNYSALRHAPLVSSALGFDDGRVLGGGSFWIRRI